MPGERPDEMRQEVRRSLGIGDDDFLIGAVGTVLPKKGQLYLVRAMPKILEREPNAKLLILGDLDQLLFH